MDPSLQPRGFSGDAAGWHEIVPPGVERSLRWPRDAVRQGAHLSLPADGDGEEGPLYEQIFVTNYSEGAGRLEDFIATCAQRLTPGGRLYFDAENLAGLRNLRVVLEGRPNALDPVGSPRYPEIAVDQRRLIRAAEAAGLIVEDVLRVPSPDQVCSGFASTMIDMGHMATRYLGDAPPARLWLCASRGVPQYGQVIVAAGERDAQCATLEQLAAILPASWSAVAIDAGRSAGEVPDFNRAVSKSDAQTVWWLRAGSMPTREQFEAMAESVLLGAIVPGEGGVPAVEGDLGGMMISRSELMAVGPIDESWSLPQFAHEDYCMRLTAAGVQIVTAGSPIDAAPCFATQPEADAEQLREEMDALVERWKDVADVGTAVYPGSQRTVRVGDEDDDGLEVPWQGREPRVTLCMIARDEERFLDECLRRASAAVDEIIVVDTGSQDRTMEIARAHGATVIEQPWEDDFAAPRNVGLAAATGDWVLVLDADEFLEDGAAEQLRQAVADPYVCGYHLHFTNVYGDDSPSGVTMIRLFRRLEGLEWVNRIHEQVSPSLLVAARTQRLTLSRADVRVQHYGYTDEVMESRDKLARNERIFKLQIDEHPEDVYSLYKYGDFLRRCPGRGADAREMLDRALDCILAQFPGCPRGAPYAGEVAALCALEAARAEEWDRAEWAIDIGLQRFMATPNLHYVAAGIALRLGREDDAIHHYRECLRYRGQTLPVPIQDGITGHVSLTGIAQAMLQKGDVVGAQRVLDRAISLKPEHDVATIILSRIHLHNGDAQAALCSLMEYLQRHPDSAGVCHQATLLLGQLGHKEHARRLGQRAIALFEADAAELEAAQVREQIAALC